MFSLVLTGNSARVDADAGADAAGPAGPVAEVTRAAADGGYPSLPEMEVRRMGCGYDIACWGSFIGIGVPDGGAGVVRIATDMVGPVISTVGMGHPSN